ncbi:N-acetylmuramoyl-L-alanine amidase family protein, partial [Faecalibacillus intestinalis]|uniref:N-acetylmuramoyl-L-alanine amidase family protein n=1 Tax=Faecalibacillus intestinalis TaxID=1982626 RepID=UPI00384F6EBE
TRCHNQLKGQWKQSGNKWWYQYEDGTYPKNEFITIDNKLYRFDQYGYMQTGWFKINKEYYYAPSSGSIQEQWVKSGNNWYYVDADGKMVTGDYAINGEVNRFDANGVWLGKI